MEPRRKRSTAKSAKSTKRATRTAPRAARHRSKPDALSALIGKRVRAFRAEQGFTFDAFVEETGLGRGYISELERGLVVPSVHTLRKLAVALEISIADLVLGDTVREQLFVLARQLQDHEVDYLVAEARRLASVKVKE